MFRQLADPDGLNNALSQVLYGLALRYSPTTLFLMSMWLFAMPSLVWRVYKGLLVFSVFEVSDFESLS